MKRNFLVVLTLTAFLLTTGMSYAQQEATATVESVQSEATGNGTGVVGDINSGNTSNSKSMERGFPVPGTARFGPVINYYGKPLPGSQFRPVESLLMYANIFSEGALESIIKRGKDADLIVDYNIVRDSNVQVRAKYEKGETRWIKIVATTQMLPEHGLIGYITAESDDRKTDMMEVMAGAALAAIQDGADVLQIVAQGAARDTETSGWGIGFNTTQATMHGGQVGDGGSNVSSGGTGYSTAWAGMRDKPWIQCNALKSPSKVIGVQMASADTGKVTEENVISTSAVPATDKVVAPVSHTPAPKKQWGTINGTPQFIAN